MQEHNNLEIQIQGYQGSLKQLVDRVKDVEHSILDISIVDIIRYFQKERKLPQTKSIALMVFCHIIAELLYLKSSFLLGELTNEKQDNTVVLVPYSAHTLIEYQKHRKLAQHLLDRYRSFADMLDRDVYFNLEPVNKTWDVRILKSTMSHLLRKHIREQFVLEKIRYIDMKTARKGVMTALQGKDSVLFSHLTSKYSKRTNKVVLYLAVLHMTQEHILNIKQMTPWKGLYVSRADV